VPESSSTAGGPLICVGELGLGNTTAAAALLAALTGSGAADTCGRGTGEVDDEDHGVRASMTLGGSGGDCQC
jgi:NaMN:DMB phosphoribosyltransferase